MQIINIYNNTFKVNLVFLYFYFEQVHVGWNGTRVHDYFHYSSLPFETV